jgi:hypothetical protein
MRTDHQACLFDTFQYRAALFNEVCHGRAGPLLDVWEAVPTWDTNLQAARHYAFEVMEDIWAPLPYLLQNLGTYLRGERAEEGASGWPGASDDADERPIMHGWQGRSSSAANLWSSYDIHSQGFRQIAAWLSWRTRSQP